MTVTAPTTRAARWPAVRPWLGTAARLGLAAVWLVAGAAKVGDLAASGRAVNAYQVMPYDVATVVGAALPFVELALGVLLLLGLATRLGRRGLRGAAGGLHRRHRLGLGAGAGHRLRLLRQRRAARRRAGPSYLPEILRDLGFLVTGRVSADLAPYARLGGRVAVRRTRRGGRG